MRNHIKSFVILSIIVSVALPSVADAAWYNPFSWFKKRPAAPAIINQGGVTTPSSTAKPQEPAAATSTKSTTKKPLPVQAKPASTTPAQTKPVQKPAVTTKDTKPAATTSVEAKVIEVPSFAATYNFQPSNFSQALTIRTGTELLAVEAKHGDVSALGNWYVDSVTWRLVGDDLRPGDMIISVSSKQNVAAESSLVNESVTTKLSAHVASDELSFKIGGPFPNRGRIHVIVEEITGRMKNDPTNTVYKFKGLPVVGPEFSL
jgi:hypothetical protein